ncbi:MAG: cell division protein SepF [Clostridia bacterium]|uniref:cell division protein SepF n=1 Tax=Blautia luti TaxID=89014 RepID=UPI000E5D746B|nr:MULTISPECIES: cell division protein SepF [Clostridia]MCB5475082.1 cell division protein SepF [Blautia luti]RHK24138.1 cell division protein SepF [Ruminococcus sp. AF46-10NS]
MGVLDKFLDAIKLNDDYDDDELLDDSILEEEDDYDDDFLDDDDDMEEKPKKKFFEKFSKKKTDEEEDYLDDEEPEKEPVKPAPAKVSAKTAAAKAPARQERVSRPASSSKITPMRSGSKRSSQAVNMEVCVIKPTTMEEAREIADTLVDNSTVILNLEGIDVELAQRIIDFTSGACYSLGGSLQQVSSYIFVLGPYNVDITGDLQNILGGSVPSVRVGY